MKTWFLFVYDTYYPDGGMDDFYASFYTREEATKVGEALLIGKCIDFFQVVDISEHLKGV